MKALVLAAFTALVALALVGPAAAQPGVQIQRIETGTKVEVPRSATPAGKGVSKRDQVESTIKPKTDAGKRTSAGMAIAFWGFAALTVLGSVFVITRRNLIAAVMGMVGTFFALAALYMLLYAHFLAIIQMLVYAGAIMVLFVFVVMILNKPEDEPFAVTGRIGKVVAGLAMAYLTFRLGSVLVDVPVDEVARAAPPPTAEGHAFGSTAAVGWNLFNDYLFPFEAVSILLLIAVVGAIAIARPLKESDGTGDVEIQPAKGH